MNAYVDVKIREPDMGAVLCPADDVVEVQPPPHRVCKGRPRVKRVRSNGFTGGTAPLSSADLSIGLPPTQQQEDYNLLVSEVAPGVAQRAVGTRERGRYTCGQCGTEGHTRKTCPQLK